METSSTLQAPAAIAATTKTTDQNDSARASPEPLDGFHRLINEINHVLGPSNGIDSEGVDVEELKTAMRSYSGSEAEWQMYGFEDLSRAYTRNLVDKGNGKSNLVCRIESFSERDTSTDYCPSSCSSGHRKSPHQSTIMPMLTASCEC